MRLLCGHTCPRDTILTASSGRTDPGEVFEGLSGQSDYRALFWHRGCDKNVAEAQVETEQKGQGRQLHFPPIVKDFTLTDDSSVVQSIASTSRRKTCPSLATISRACSRR